MTAHTKDIDVLIDAEQISNRIGELGAQITADYAGCEELCMVGILKGSFIFFADLARQIDLKVRCEFIGVSSYGEGQQSSGAVQLTSDLTSPIEGCDTLIIEDIVDTGLTLQYLRENFATRRPKTLRTASLLDKPGNREVEVGVDYAGFSIPNHFVVGYGLDLANHYRNLPYIGVYKGNG